MLLPADPLPQTGTADGAADGTAGRPDVPAPAAPLPTSPEQLLDRLAALGLATTTYDHPPVFTVEESKALRGELPGGHCKTLLLKDKSGALWLVVALEDRMLDLKRLHRRLGSGRLSFASPDLLWRVLGVHPGSVTPFALINDREALVSVVLDAGMMDCPLLNFHPLVNHRTTAIRPDGLLSFIAACGHRSRVLELGCGAEEAKEAEMEHQAAAGLSRPESTLI